MLAKIPAPGRAVAFASLCLLIAGGAACQSDENNASATAVAPLAPAVAAPLAVDRALDDRFAFIAGLATGSPSYAALEAEPAWRDYAKAADKAWLEFEAAVLEPMRTWAASDLALARERTETLFYPFGGPDLATAQALFPEQPVTVLLGLEPVGNLPELDRSTLAARTVFYTDMGALVLDFLTRGYFITKEMTDIYSRREVDGALPVIGFFLKREGTPWQASGGWRPRPMALGRKPPMCSSAERPRRPYGIRIDYFKPGESRPQNGLLFLLRRREPRVHGGIAPAPVPGRSRAPDDLHQGRLLPPPLGQLLDAAGPHSRPEPLCPRGRHGHPVSLLREGRLGALRSSAATRRRSRISPMSSRRTCAPPTQDPETKVRPLPFHFGYRWRSQVDNLLLAERPQRPYKVPVSGKRGSAGKQGFEP
ncbi:MAG: hypothetical protein M0C28_45945 [Candidatus Moduliflexus flocculans]|nr:hypothetical protein [Candidatus Moduliflexus flocculans]